jgi:hypothetical protein
MRYLKRKIFLACESSLKSSSSDEDQLIQHEANSSQMQALEAKPKRARSTKRNRIVDFPNGSFKTRSTKNLVKNYARAIIIFGKSKCAEPYINRLIEEKKFNFSVNDFVTFINPFKGEVTSIAKFRDLLTIGKKSSQREKEFKGILKELAVIFIKYFSVNWIYSGRVTYKKAHLNCRFWILKKIRNPELLVSGNRW